MERIELEEAINGLVGLLRARESAEDKCQGYFEDNRIVFEILGYEEAYPKLRLPMQNGDYLEPDFLVKRPNGLFEIFELKTPQEKLVKTKRHRDDLYARVSEYVAQVETYSEYFDDRENRERVLRTYSLDVQKKPDTIMVAGLDEDVDKKLLHNLIRRRSNALRVITYDEILSTLLFYHAKFFGYAENLTGASWHAIINLQELEVQRRKYIFDVGDSPFKNRWSIYLDEKDSFCLEIVDSSGTSHQVAVHPGTLDFELGQFCYLCCEFGNSDSFSVLQILVNNRIAVKRELASPIDIARGLDFSKRTIGSDLEGQNGGLFDLAELCVYDRVLEFRARAKLTDHFFEKYFTDHLSG